VSLLLSKLLLAPLLVIGASLAGRRWGPRASGLLVALPLVAGPILFIASAEHGARFGAHAASASLLGLAALAAFVVVVVKTSRSRAWLKVLASGWLVYLTVALAFSTVTPAPALGLTVAAGAFLLAGLLTRDRGAALDGRPSSTLPKWDIPARAVATAALVLAVTGLSAALGPAVTGVLAPFPVSTSVLAGFVLVQHGPRHVGELLRGFLRGALGFAFFCFLVAVLLVPLGAPAAFAIGLCGALLVQLAAQIVPRPAVATLNVSD
jgi:hypothetical protein